jgi:hypothetical protein
MLLAHAPVDQLIDGALNMRGRNTLAVPVCLGVSPDSRCAYNRSEARLASLRYFQTKPHPGHSEFRHIHTIVPEHPLHAVQVCPVSGEAFLAIIPIGEIQELLFDSRDPSHNMEPIQISIAFKS